MVKSDPTIFNFKSLTEEECEYIGLCYDDVVDLEDDTVTSSGVVSSCNDGIDISKARYVFLEPW